MASTQTKSDTRRVGNLPTNAQLETIATLADALGVEAPSPETVREADEMIGKLKSAYDERDGDPELVLTTEPDEEPTPGEPEPDLPPPPVDPGLSVEETQKLFDKAVSAFGSALRTVFGVEELQPSQTPGVVGFLLPGFTEELPHDNFTRCTTCNGYGDVLTGSTKAGNERRPCPDPRCKGLGFWQKASAPQPVAPTLIAVPQPATNGDGEYGEAPTWLGDPNLTAPAV